MEKKPQIISEDRLVFFDCDDTLVMWKRDGSYQPGDPGVIAIPDPYFSPSPYSTKYEPLIYLVPHKLHIRKLKGYARSGQFVVVWSAGGWKWARNVVAALGLEEHVNLVMGKPQHLYDDLPLNEAIGTRHYYQPKKIKEGSHES